MIWLLLIPSEAGLSPARLSVVALLLTCAIGGIIFTIKPPLFTTNLVQYRSIFLSLLLAFLSGSTLFLLRYSNPQMLLASYIRLAPVLSFCLILGLQSAMFFLGFRNGIAWREFSTRRNIYKVGLVAFCIFMLLVLFVNLTKLGITKDPAYWGEPGVPIVGWQAVVSLLIGFGMLLASLRYAYDSHRFIYHLVIPAALWMISFSIWLSVPWNVLQNSFYAPITPPSNVPFPYSDAGTYDLFAQSILIGESYQGVIPPRPVYVLFLTILHYLFNQNYFSIITAQVILLALFPVLLYYLGKKIHSPAAGVVAAFFAIFRELTSLWISSNTRVVNSRILATDFLAALAILLVCLMSIKWLENRDTRYALLAGGSFGLLLLIRTQAIIILPFVLSAAWIVLGDITLRRRSGKKIHPKSIGKPHPKGSFPLTKSWFLSIGFFFFALLFAVTPWLIHNFTVTGKFAFDDPNQMGIIYSQYSFTGNLEFSRFNIKTDSLLNSLAEFTVQHPAFVAGFITNHFLNTEIGGLLALPLIQRFDGLFEPVNLYWLSWDGSLYWYNFVLILIYLGIIGIGLGAAWAKMRLIGLLPLFMNLGYALSNGIARFSSWRYNLPIDWVPYFYFGVGVVEILVGICILFGVRAKPLVDINKDNKSIAKVPWFPTLSAFILMTFFIIGSLPWLIKYFTPPRFSISRDSLIQKVSPAVENPAQIEAFLSSPQAVIYEGRLLYPRFYRRDLGLSSTNPWPVYALREFPRIGFVLLNESNLQMIFPTREPLNFIHGEDIIVLGCAQPEYIEARFVYFPNLVEKYISMPLNTMCN